MDWNFDHQCTADSSGSSKPEYFGQHAGVSFIFRYLFPVFGIARIDDFLFYQCCNRSDDCDCSSHHLFCNLCVRKEKCMMRTTKKGRKGALLLTFLLAGSLLFSGCKKEETVEYPAVIGCCDGISGWQHFAGVSGWFHRKLLELSGGSTDKIQLSSGSRWQCNLMVRIQRCRHSLTTGLHKRTEVIL